MKGASPEGMAALERLRGIFAEFEDVDERVSHGEAAWFIRGGRQVAMLSDHHRDDGVAVWLATPPGMQEALIGADPARYFRPPYVGHRGWVGVVLDADGDWEAVAGLAAMAVEAARGSKRSRR
ncbi:MmcQ/YjbR family DNA-binding protein [Tepidiforma sp.]|uniref:MmcQ/YjbR family DNA-binding protein n=1 Tax=Tepidiforma sp. TaxID=2682230 RepID=UPI002ADE58C6|nr:MmcQ/YjbR family DNA-binding protein [Tepidiforma sp.]